MITPVFRRIAIPFGLLVVALAFGFDAYVTRSGCASVPGCPPRALLVVTALGLLAALVLAYLVARRTVQPMQDLAEVARRIAAGDDTARVLSSRRDESAALIDAVNQIVDSQRERINELVQDHRQFSTVLEHMADGVLITDNLGLVRLINPAACRLLKTGEGEALGLSLIHI